MRRCRLIYLETTVFGNSSSRDVIAQKFSQELLYVGVIKWLSEIQEGKFKWFKSDLGATILSVNNGEKKWFGKSTTEIVAFCRPIRKMYKRKEKKALCAVLNFINNTNKMSKKNKWLQYLYIFK